MQTLKITWADGKIQHIDVHCGRSMYARRLPKSIGVALETGRATAVLEYDGLPRTAILTGGRYYMRIARPYQSVSPDGFGVFYDEE